MDGGQGSDVKLSAMAVGASGLYRLDGFNEIFGPRSLMYQQH